MGDEILAIKDDVVEDEKPTEANDDVMSDELEISDEARKTENERRKQIKDAHRDKIKNKKAIK